MKKHVLFVVLLFVYSETFSQFKSSDLSFTLGYPIPVGHNFVNKGAGDGYTGIIDIGLDYTILKADKFDFGILMNTSFLTFKLTDVRLNTLSPKIKAGYTIQSKKLDFQPQLAVGYTRFSSSNPEYDYNEAAGGIAARASTKVILKSEKKINFYFILAYEFNRIGKLSPNIVDESFNRNIQFVTPGLGVLWKFSRL